MAPSTDRVLLTVSESIWVNRPPEAVFDYTADFATRTEWDYSITEVTILSASPRTARIAVPGVGHTTVVTRLDRRPERTSAVFQDVDSRWITGGGGAWKYEPEGDVTRWTVTNTLEFKPSWLMRLVRSVITRAGGLPRWCLTVECDRPSPLTVRIGSGHLTRIPPPCGVADHPGGRST